MAELQSVNTGAASETNDIIYVQRDWMNMVYQLCMCILQEYK